MKRFGIIFMAFLACSQAHGQVKTLQKAKAQNTAPTADKAFLQPVSVKYRMPATLKGARLKKLAIDYNDIIYTLTDKGLFMVSGDELTQDLRYTPLADKIPVDIAIREGSGLLYYLYDDH